MNEMLVKDNGGMELDISTEKRDMGSKESSFSLLICDETFELYQEDLKFEDNEEVKDTHESWKPLFPNYIQEQLSKEGFYQPKCHDIDCCPSGISALMRAILIDWLQKLCYEEGLKRETFHQCVSHLDRILCIDPCINRDNFQLYGLVALYLSCKTEVTII